MPHKGGKSHIFFLLPCLPGSFIELTVVQRQELRMCSSQRTEKVLTNWRMRRGLWFFVSSVLVVFKVSHLGRSCSAAATAATKTPIETPLPLSVGLGKDMMMPKRV